MKITSIIIFSCSKLCIRYCCSLYACKTENTKKKALSASLYTLSNVTNWHCWVASELVFYYSFRFHYRTWTTSQCILQGITHSSSRFCCHWATFSNTSQESHFSITKMIKITKKKKNVSRDTFGERDACEILGWSTVSQLKIKFTDSRYVPEFFSASCIQRVGRCFDQESCSILWFSSLCGPSTFPCWQVTTGPGGGKF